MSLKISQISPSVIKDLDTDLPNWRDLIPEDKAANLNEETLIQLLKDRKRAEIYRIIADKRNAMFKEMYTREDKSVLELTKEFGIFSYEQTAKWWDIENKLNSIILKFRARGKIEDVKKLRPSFNAITQKLNEIIDAGEKETEVSIKTIMNNTINVVSGGNDEATKELNDLFNTQIPKFQQENKEVFNDYKEFINGSLGELINDKISKIEQGELSSDSLKRSDLFTDEEEKELENKCIQTVEKIINRRRKLNSESFKDVIAKKGFEGKDKFLEKIDEISTDLISNETKQAIKYAINSDFILPLKESDLNNRDKRAIPVIGKAAKVISNILKITASLLREEAKKRKNKPLIRTDFYKWCNEDTYGLGHILTLGACTGWTIAELEANWKLNKSLDLNGIAGILGYISFLLDIVGKVDYMTAFIDRYLVDSCKTVMNLANICELSDLCNLLLGVSKNLEEKIKNYLKSKKLIT